MSMDEIYQSMIQPRGAAYRDNQIQPWSHYGEPIDRSAGRLAGHSRIWGDASPEVQSRVIDTLIDASRRAGLDPRQTAYVLAIARVESGFNPDAAAGTTSAFGLGQFIDRTASAYGLNDQNRYDVNRQADALVAHYVDNRNLARSRGQGDEYIYKYHHDGPTRDYGGLGISDRNVMPYVDRYEQFARERLQQANATMHAPAQTRQSTDAITAGQPTSFQEVMDAMLPNQGGARPHITGQFGEHRANGHHGGVDFNYVGGQNGINLRHPVVRSPVSGTVVYGDGEGQYGTVKIRDAHGNTHEILHLDSRAVRSGQPIEAGDPIGTMGGRGPRGSNQYAQHVHYQLRDQNGRIIDPIDHWDRQRVQVSASPVATQRLPANAMMDGVLKQGERGDDIHGLQQSLNQLGVRDARGRALAEDGDFGQRTREAVEAFQRTNGLRVDGIAGPDTLTRIGQQLPRQAAVTATAGITDLVAEQPRTLADPGHPNHALYRQAYDGLSGIDPQRLGFRSEQELRNVAGTLAFEARVSGLGRIDHVVANRDGSGLFAIQGRMDDPTHHRIYVDMTQAATQPLERSTQQIDQEPQQQSEPVRQRSAVMV